MEMVGDLEELDGVHGKAAAVSFLPAGHVGPGDVPLDIGVRPDRHRVFLPGEEVARFGHVAGGKNSLCRGLHPVVHDDAAVYLDLAPFQEAGRRADPDGDDDRVAGDEVTRFQGHAGDLGAFALNFDHGVLGDDVDAVGFHLLGHDPAGRAVKGGGEDTVGQFDDGDLFVEQMEPFRCLEPDETAADHHHPLDVVRPCPFSLAASSQVVKVKTFSLSGQPDDGGDKRDHRRWR